MKTPKKCLCVCHTHLGKGGLIHETECCKKMNGIVICKECQFEEGHSLKCSKYDDEFSRLKGAPRYEKQMTDDQYNEKERCTHQGHCKGRCGKPL